MTRKIGQELYNLRLICDMATNFPKIWHSMHLGKTMQTAISLRTSRKVIVFWLGTLSFDGKIAGHPFKTSLATKVSVLPAGVRRS